MSFKMKNKILGLLLALTIFNPTAVIAAGTGTPLPVYSGVDSSIEQYLCTPSKNPQGQDLANCINKLYRFGIAFGAIALVFFLVFAGYLYITGGESGKTKGKSMMINALVGMTILLTSYLLLGFINPDLTRFKPINPPVFVDPGIPDDCTAFGLGADCNNPSHGDEADNAPGGGSMPSGTATACKGGIISTPSSIPHTASASRICKDLADRLAGLKALTPGISWVLTSSIHGTHSSSCHSAGNANSGNCADIGLNGGQSPSYDKNNGGSTNPKWGPLCQAIAKLGGVNFANEASNQPACQQIKAYHVEKFTSGPNLHTNYIGN